MTINEKKVLKFNVSSFRKIPNPYINSNNVSEKKPEMYILICDVTDIPDDIPMQTNPRMQNEKTKVAKKIQDSLLNVNDRYFYLLNRGLLLSAKDVSYNNETNVVSVTFEDLNYHGNVDGGHTYKIIKEYKKSLEKNQQFVKIEILTGVEDFFENLAAARNTSVQVTDQSIAELEKRFGLIKKAFKDEKFIDDISYKQNDVKRIDVSDILAILNLFNIDKYPLNKNSYPINSYNGKKSCIDSYINESKKHENDIENNPYYKMKNIMCDIARLYDNLEENMHNYYKGENVGTKKYGSITGVAMAKSGKQTFYTMFYEKELQYKTPNGFLYPILGAFRALLIEKNGFYEWSMNPFKVMDKVGPKLVESTIGMSRDLGNNPNATGKNNNLWSMLFMMVQFEVLNKGN